VLPQVFFRRLLRERPYRKRVLYVLNNIRRTKSYGAQTTRTGKVEIHILGLVLPTAKFSQIEIHPKNV
jgi:CRISPR-associated protein Csc2